MRSSHRQPESQNPVAIVRPRWDEFLARLRFLPTDLIAQIRELNRPALDELVQLEQAAQSLIAAARELGDSDPESIRPEYRSVVDAAGVAVQHYIRRSDLKLFQAGHLLDSITVAAEILQMLSQCTELQNLTDWSKFGSAADTLGWLARKFETLVPIYAEAALGD